MVVSGITGSVVKGAHAWLSAGGSGVRYPSGSGARVRHVVLGNPGCATWRRCAGTPTAP
jgi:hypothetical protein